LLDELLRPTTKLHKTFSNCLFSPREQVIEGGRPAAVTLFTFCASADL
jgi:hypothetical protein